MYDEKQPEKINTRKNWIKFGLMATAVAVGSYYGVGRHVKAGTKAINANINSIGQFMAEQADDHDAFRAAQRSAIVAARNAGTGFTYYPGLGVLHHAKEL